MNQKNSLPTVSIRPLEKQDLFILWQLIYGTPNPEWKKWDAPYFPLTPISFDEYIEKKTSVTSQSNELAQEWVIEINQQIIGTICYYWEHKPSLWLELGIVIYLPKYWSGGYGTKALSQMIDQVFTYLPVPRVGITTWSGNIRMMKLAEKVGMKLEGRMRNCRIVNGKFYDSIRMGMLREEWIEMKGEKLNIVNKRRNM